MKNKKKVNWLVGVLFLVLCGLIIHAISDSKNKTEKTVDSTGVSETIENNNQQDFSQIVVQKATKEHSEYLSEELKELPTEQKEELANYLNESNLKIKENTDDGLKTVNIVVKNWFDLDIILTEYDNYTTKGERMVSIRVVNNSNADDIELFENTNSLSGGYSTNHYEKFKTTQSTEEILKEKIKTLVSDLRYKYKETNEEALMDISGYKLIVPVTKEKTELEGTVVFPKDSKKNISEYKVEEKDMNLIFKVYDSKLDEKYLLTGTEDTKIEITDFKAVKRINDDEIKVKFKTNADLKELDSERYSIYVELQGTSNVIYKVGD